MCISSDAYVASRVFQRLVARGVDAKRAEAVARKVARRYGDRRNYMYLSYLAGVEAGRALPAPIAVERLEPDPSGSLLDGVDRTRDDAVASGGDADAPADRLARPEH